MYYVKSNYIPTTKKALKIRYICDEVFIKILLRIRIHYSLFHCIVRLQFSNANDILPKICQQCCQLCLFDCVSHYDVKLPELARLVIHEFTLKSEIFQPTKLVENLPNVLVVTKLLFFFQHVLIMYLMLARFFVVNQT